MTMYNICESGDREFPTPTGLLAPLVRLWTAAKERIEEHRAVHQLYQLDARVLRDMGFDPYAIYEGREGAIGEWKSRKCGE